jgi:hypothetical protein
MKEVYNQISFWNARDFFLITCSFFSLCKLLFTDKRLLFRQLLVIYSLSVFFIISSYHIIDRFFKDTFPQPIKIQESLNFIYNGVELFVFFSIFLKIFLSQTIRKLILYTLILILSVNITIFLFAINIPLNTLRILADQLCVLNLLLLLLGCTWYFFEIYKSTTPFNMGLTIIIFSLTAYCLISIPFIAVSTYISSDFKLLYNFYFSLHYLLLATICLSFIFYSSKNSSSRNSYFHNSA